MSSQPLLTTVPAGELLELRPAGAWIAANVTALETLAAAANPEVDRSKGVRLDMSGVSELDTLGAWLLEKLTRRAATTGRRAEFVGVSENYSGLIDEIREVNRHNPAAVPRPNPVIARLGDL